MSSAVGNTKIKQVKSDSLSASDVCVVLLALLALISTVYSMFIFSNMNSIIMDKNLTLVEIQAVEAYFSFNVIIFVLSCFFTMFIRFDGKVSKTLGFFALVSPMVFFIVIEVLIVTNQIAITHFRASNLYPSKDNLELFSDVIKGLPNNPIDLFSTMKQFGSINIEGCKYLGRIVDSKGAYASSIENLCVNGHSPAKAIFKYLYLGLFSSVMVVVSAYLSLSKHVNLFSTAANR